MGKVKKPAEFSADKKTETPPGTFHPVYVVFGADDGLRSRGLQTLLEQFGADGNLTEYAGTSVVLADVLDELRTIPLLGDRRIVVVRDADNFVTRYRANLEDYLDKPSATGTLVLDVRKWPSNTRLAKKVDKIGQAARCEPPSGREFEGWLAQYATSLGKRIAPQAVQMLRDLLGKDAPAIYLSEIEKLVTYVGDRPQIQIEDVQALVSPMRAEIVFAVTDAMAERNVGRALGLWEQVLATDKEAQFKAIGGLAWGLRKLIKARRLMDRGMSPDQAAREGGLWGPTAVQRVQTFSTRQLEGQLARLAEIDVSSKSGGDIRTEVQNFIVTACNAPGATSRR
jgi:DNA polymerase III subunit delta